MRRIEYRTVAALLIGWALASACSASRVGSGAVPATAAASSAAAQPAAAQADDSSSLRQGVITAITDRGDRMQVQGVWCDVGAGLTMVLRAGQQARLDSLKAGDTIRFTLAPGQNERPVIRVIYAQ